MKKKFLIVSVLLLLTIGVYCYQKNNYLVDSLKLEVSDKKAESVDEYVEKNIHILKNSYDNNSTEVKKEIDKFSKNIAAIVCVMDYDNIKKINNSKFIGESIFMEDFYGKDVEYELLPYANEDGIIQYISYKYFDKKERKYLIAHTECVSKLKLYSYPPLSLSDALNILEKKYPDKSFSIRDGFWYLKKQTASDPLYIFYEDEVHYVVSAKSGKIFTIEKEETNNKQKDSKIARYEDGKFYLKKITHNLSEDRINIESINLVNTFIDWGCGEFDDNMEVIDISALQKKCSKDFISKNFNESEFDEQVESKLKDIYGDKYIEPTRQDEVNQNNESIELEYGDFKVIDGNINQLNN